MKRFVKIILLRSSIITIFFFFFINSRFCIADTSQLPFSVGEKVRYAIIAAGFYVGYQTIEIMAIEKMGGSEIIRLYGVSRTAPFISIFYRLNDQWTILMDKDSLLPLRVEKDMVEGKNRGYFVYTIDQENSTVVIQNITEGKEKVVQSENVVFDLFSLVYFFRKYTSEFDKTFTFDFLEAKTVRTVHFQNEGELDIRIPRLNDEDTTRANKIQQVGGIGIQIYVGTDSLKLPLKMIVPSKLPRNKVITIEFVIQKYVPGEEQTDVPEMYRRIRY